MLQLDARGVEGQHADRLRYVVTAFNDLHTVNPTRSIGFGGGDLALAADPSRAAHFFDSRKTSPEPPAWAEWRGRRIPCLFCDHSDPLGCASAMHDGQIRFDLLAAVFYFLSSWDDAIHERGPEPGTSYVERHELTEIPTVNLYFDLIAEALRQRGDTQVRARIASELDAGFVAVSHDVDRCQTGWWHDAMDHWKERRWREVTRVLRQRLHGEDPWFNFHEVVKTDRELGFAATYYLLARNGRIDGIPHADYDVRDPRLQKAIAFLIEEQAEIGVHGSVAAHGNERRLTEEMQKIGRPISGNRFHYLKLKIPKSYRVIERAGLRYDSSLGFAHRIGFRNGMCCPYRPYDFERRQAFKCWQLPLIVMDQSLIQPGYLGYDPDQALVVLKRVFAQVQQVGGVLTLLWHNTLFTRPRYRPWREVYRAFLTHCREVGGQLTNANQILSRLVSEVDGVPTLGTRKQGDADVD